MRFLEFKILVEYNLQTTIQKQGEKIKSAADAKEAEDIPIENILKKLELMDPTPNKKFMMWIVKQYTTSEDFKLNDIEKVKTVLSQYEKYKKRLPQEKRDINRLSLPAVKEITDNLENENNESQYKNRDDVILLYDGPLGLLISPKTEESSCELGSGTKWCTAATDSTNYFSKYSDPLFIYFKKPGKEKYQIYLPFSQTSFRQVEIKDRSNNTPSPEIINQLRNSNIKQLRKLFEKYEDTVLFNGESSGYSLLHYRDIIFGKDVRWDKLENYLLTSDNLSAIIEYAKETIKGRWDKLENYLLTSDNLSAIIEYAKEIIKGRWPEAEKVLGNKKSIYSTKEYTKHFLKGKYRSDDWEILENSIINSIEKDDAYTILRYAEEIIEGRFLRAEKFLGKYSSFYNIKNYVNQFKGESYNSDDWETLENSILESIDSENTRTIERYSEEIIEGRWRKAEALLGKHGRMYAIFDYVDEFKGESYNSNDWEILEKSLIETKDISDLIRYAQRVIGGRWKRLEKKLLSDGTSNEITQYMIVIQNDDETYDDEDWKNLENKFQELTNQKN